MKIERLCRTGKRLLVTLAVCVMGETKASNSFVHELHEARPFLRWQRPTYTNYALQPYQNYPNHTFPYWDVPSPA